AKSTDRIGLGLFYSADVVGYYQNAIGLYDNSILSTLVQLHTVGSAALSKLQSNPVALRQKIRSSIVCSGVFRDAHGGDPVGDGRRPDGHFVGRKMAGGRLTAEHYCVARYFPSC